MFAVAALTLSRLVALCLKVVEVRGNSSRASPGQTWIAGRSCGGLFTPMLNWHMSDHVRLEFSYGVGNLDRFELNGVTHFFQTRLQLSL